MESTYSFGGFGLEPLYGYGTDAEAIKFLQCLNKDRELNQYYAYASDEKDYSFSIAEALIEVEENK